MKPRVKFFHCADSTTKFALFKLFNVNSIITLIIRGFEKHKKSEKEESWVYKRLLTV